MSERAPPASPTVWSATSPPRSPSTRATCTERPATRSPTSSTAAASAAAAPEVPRHYGPAYAPDQAAQHLLIRGTTDIELFDPILKIFSTLNPNLAIVYEQWASNQLYDYAVAACVDQVEAADILISSSVDQQFKLVNDGCAQSHASAATQSLPQGMNWRDDDVKDVGAAE